MAKKYFTDESLGTFVDEIKLYTDNAVSTKANSSHNHAASNITSGTLSSDRLPIVPITKGGTGATTADAALTNLGITATVSELNKLDGLTTTTTELNYVDGVTSNIQTQLDSKGEPPFIVTITGSDSSGYTADKTYAEIEEAYNANRQVIAFVNSTWVHLVGLAFNTAIFSTLLSLGGTCVAYEVMITSSDVSVMFTNVYTANSKPTPSDIGAAAASHTHGAATTSTAGFMSTSDKSKLDGIATGATANTGTITGVSANGTSVATSGVANIPAASTSAYGVTKLSSSTSSTSTSLAATASAVKAAYDLANGKANASDLTSHTGNTSNPHGVTAAQVGAVPTSRTVNGKALSADITLSASDVGAAASSHNQAASTITAGTLGGKVVANTTAVATLGNAQVRNIYITATDLTAGTSSLTTGNICLVYE